MTRLLDEMAETKYRIAELKRGYETGERLDLTPWVRASEEMGTVVPKTGIELYAERNGELHVLCHDMLNALEYLGCEPDIIHGFRKRLHNVPQCRGV